MPSAMPAPVLESADASSTVAPLVPWTPAGDPVSSAATTSTNTSFSSSSPPPSPERQDAVAGGVAKRRLLKAWLVEHGFVTAHSSKATARGRVSYPLHEAVRQNNPQIVQLLLEADADERKRDARGLTPEQLAVRRAWRVSSDAVVSLLQRAAAAREAAATTEAPCGTVAEGRGGVARPARAA
mmetsp:Transcript_118363/g.339728  ORF Transcript_118363/g.339728 Transcript_118363/m.339728 type:complete len:183 (-) Transcript_118363:89-637(-)